MKDLIIKILVWLAIAAIGILWFTAMVIVINNIFLNMEL